MPTEVSEKPAPRATAPRPRSLAWPLGAALLVTLAVSGAGVAVHRATEAAGDIAEVSHRASRLDAALRRVLEPPQEALHGIGGLFDAHPETSRSEFRRFVQPALARHPSLYALEWLPRVRHEQRAALEASARLEGLDGFEITELDASGGFVRAADRREYVPILFAEPPNAAMGFDVVSEAGRRTDAYRARDTGEVVATRRFRLAEDLEGDYSVALYLPVYDGRAVPPTPEARRAAHRGFAVEVVRVGALVRAATAGHDLSGLQVAVLDAAAGEEDRVLWESAPTASRPGGAPDPLLVESELAFGARPWKLLVRGTPGLAGAGSPAALAAGPAVGLALLLGLLGLARVRRLERQATEAAELGQYRLVSRLGGGGMGEVYLARHAMLRRPTAIKLLTSEQTDAVARFEREVQAASALSHPNTIAIYDYGRTPDGVFYYVMELVDGMTLEDMVQRDGPMPPARVVHVLRQVCGALEEAHRAGIVHRDIKPSNLMLCNRGGVHDFVKVLDFGLVKELSGDDSDRSLAGQIVGTPLYMAPEAAADTRKVDARSDLYSLGAVAYFLLTGRPPFEGPTATAVMAMHLSDPPDPPSAHAPQPIPHALEDLVLRCLGKRRRDRPMSAAAMREALERMVQATGEWTQDDAQLWWAAEGPRLLSEVAAARRGDAAEGVGARTVVARRRAGGPTAS